jgi:hypothetical protein
LLSICLLNCIYFLFMVFIHFILLTCN